MHYLYILYSKKTDSYYIGETADMDMRIIKHNNHYYKKGFTKIAADWLPKLDFKCSSKQNALYLEKFIKRMKSRKFLEKIIADPSILQEILDKK